MDPSAQILPGAGPFSFGEGPHAVLFLHGWTSSARDLRFLAEKISRSGFHCRGLLLKGHGTPSIQNLHGVRFEDHMEECGKAFDELAASHEKVSVCGFSVGGLLALHLALGRPVANLMLLAPFLRPAGKTLGLPNWWLAGRLPLFGDLRKRGGGPIADPVALRQHIAYGALPGAGLSSIFRASRKFRGEESRVTVPTAIFHGVHDGTSDFAASLALIRNLGSQDKTLAAFNRGNHVISLDYDRAQIEAEIVDWLCRHR